MADDVQRDPGQTIRAGIAGEFFVAAELSKRDWIATLTAKNTPDVHVLASWPTGDVQARIQVRRGSRTMPMPRVSGVSSSSSVIATS
jgi:hypothetical protein